MGIEMIGLLGSPYTSNFKREPQPMFVVNQLARTEWLPCRADNSICRTSVPIDRFAMQRLDYAGFSI